MGRNLTQETVPSTAGCNPVGVGEAGGTLRGVFEENGGGTEDAEGVLFPGSSASLLQCLRLSACPCPHPALFSFFRTTSLFLTSRTPAATPHPRRPPRPPRQRPRSRPAPRRLLPYTLLLSAQGSRRISTCQVPYTRGRSQGEESGPCQSRVQASPPEK